MNLSRSATVTWPAVGLAIAAWVAGLGLIYSGPRSAPSIPLDGLVWATPFLALAAIGGLITVRQPRNRIGWLLLGISLLQGISLFGTSLVRYLYAADPGMGLAAWLELASGALSAVASGLLAFVVLTFPDGRLPSPRWRWLAAVLVLFGALAVADVVASPDPQLPVGLPVSPLANRGLARLLDPLVSGPVVGLLYLAAAASLPFRYRSGGPVLRKQIKWFGLGVAVLAVFSAARGLESILGSSPPPSVGSVVGTVTQTLALLGVPAAIGIAVLRHRLFDIDMIISRALAYGALALLSTAIYIVLVVGVGAELGRTAGTNLILSIVATALVAVAFQPLRQWLRAAANRVVYGRRQAPYESLTGFTRRLAGSYSIEEVLPGMVEAIAEGLRCRAAAVMLDERPVPRAAARWPPSAQLPDGPPDEVVVVTHQGKRHGSLAVWAHAGENLTANEQRVLSDLALQAGLVLHNARLSAELERRLEELRASRLRLVNAQDRERRRLERDLHDGAQQDLVTLRMKLGVAEVAARTSSSPLAVVLSELREDTAATLENIRRLSRGLYPPLLESQGLAAALAAHARRVPVPVRLNASDRRFARDVETAIYFCCVEALQNAAKHACASLAWISISTGDGQICFEVGDNGGGFDIAVPCAGSGLQNIRDRIDALQGTVEIQSGPAGTCIRGELPLRQ